MLTFRSHKTITKVLIVFYVVFNPEGRPNPVPTTSWATSKNSPRPSCCACWGQSCKYVSTVSRLLLLIVFFNHEKVGMGCLLSVLVENLLNLEA